MEFNSNNLKDLTEREQGLSPELSELLRSSHPGDDLLAWDRVVSLVESAPPVRLPWYVAFLDSYQRQLRFAAAPLLVLLLVAGLGIMPAQSLNVGTAITVDLPQDWTSDSAQFMELRQASELAFNALALPQSDIKLNVIEQNSGVRLVMVLSGTDSQQAGSFYADLASDFPVLAAVQHDMVPIEARLHDSMLRELVARIGSSSDISSMDDNQLNLLVFRTLKDSGFSNIRLDIHRTAEGLVQIDVEADLTNEGSISEMSLDELIDSGFSAGSVGPDAADTLQNEIGVEP